MQRYAIYYAPRPGAFADRAAAWLAGDAVVAGLPVKSRSITSDPRRYGFHGTLRAPFRPAAGVGCEIVGDVVAALAAKMSPIMCEGLRLDNLNGFLALTPIGCQTALRRLGAAVVEGTDTLRAPLTEDEVARRRPESLSARQQALMRRWGYPYVMEEFCFHLTLTDRLDVDLADPVAQALAAHFAPVLPRPFVIEDLCMFGQDAAGKFHLLHRYPLGG